MIKPTFFALFALLCISVNGFVTPTNSAVSTSMTPKHAASPVMPSTTTTLLEMGRQWNFNDGRGPFGLKKNAEIWNGRVAQMCFVVVLLQELITGKGVIEGIQDGNVFNLAMAGLTAASIFGLTVFLAFKGKEDYINLK